VPSRFSVLAGSAPGAYTAFCAGAAGAILAVACVRPALCLRLKAAVEEGKHAEALDIQQRLNPLARAVTTGFGIAGLKAALDLCGFAGGAPRPPLTPVTSDAVERIRTLLNDTAD
jgi:4-hydroxy-2-oxoglutarate aldolase